MTKEIQVGPLQAQQRQTVNIEFFSYSGQAAVKYTEISIKQLNEMVKFNVSQEVWF